MKTAKLLILLVAATASFPALGASAAPRLIASDPADHAEVAHVAQVTLRFDTRLDPARSGVDVEMTGMAGMDHHAPMKITGVRLALSAEGTTITATMPRPLVSGTYALHWHAASADTGPALGIIAITVR